MLSIDHMLSIISLLSRKSQRQMLARVGRNGTSQMLGKGSQADLRFVMIPFVLSHMTPLVILL
jgi:hypothetical protein